MYFHQQEADILRPLILYILLLLRSSIIYIIEGFKVINTDFVEKYVTHTIDKSKFYCIFAL